MQRSGHFWLTLALMAIFLIETWCSQSADAQTRRTIQATVGRRTETGWPLAADQQRFVLLRRDGSMKTIERSAVTEIKTISNEFVPYSFDKCVKRLSEIYGSAYQVTSTRHFVIVHPRGKHDQWSSLLEQVYAQFHVYFSSMGFKVRSPEFPLIVIVFKQRSEFDAYTIRRGSTPRKQVVGYYMPGNNRIVTYDQSFSDKNTKTLIHEITHQVAFNTGVQNRYAQPPVWICEGLAVMFEAPGIRNRQQYPKFQNRIHAGHLQNFKLISENGKLTGTLRKVVTGDQVFQSDTLNAYSTAWALTYFLSQTQPTQMTNYLHRLANRTDFSSYSSKQRWSDFASHFGSDIDDLEHRMQQYFAKSR